MFNARQNNAGWRIDYFVVSDRLSDTIHDATIHPDVMGSDHCPVGLDLNITCNGSIWSPEITAPKNEEPTTADGDSSAGHIRRFVPLVFTSILALLLLAPALWLMNPPPEDTQPTAIPEAESSPVDKMVVSEIIDRTGTVYPMEDTGISTSSYLRRYLSNGNEAWDLADSHFVFGSYLYIDENNYIEPNYYVQLVFDPAFQFTYDDVPIVTATSHAQVGTAGKHDCVFTSYYYGENRAYAGVFVYGYASNTIMLEITVQHDNAIPHTYEVTVTPYKDLSKYTTEQLVSIIQSSGRIKAGYLSVNIDAFERMIRSDLYIRELTIRPDAVSVLLDYYESDRYSFFSCPSVLLKYEPFLSLMTDEEKARYDEIKEQNANNQADGSEIVFG